MSQLLSGKFGKKMLSSTGMFKKIHLYDVNIMRPIEMFIKKTFDDKKTRRLSEKWEYQHFFFSSSLPPPVLPILKGIFPRLTMAAHKCLYSFYFFSVVFNGLQVFYNKYFYNEKTITKTQNPFPPNSVFKNKSEYISYFSI